MLLAKVAGGINAALSSALFVVNALPSKAAQLAAALQEKAASDPSILAGGAAPAVAAEETVEA